jgi:hypothetical protein
VSTIATEEYAEVDREGNEVDVGELRESKERAIRSRSSERTPRALRTSPWIE